MSILFRDPFNIPLWELRHVNVNNFGLNWHDVCIEQLVGDRRSQQYPIRVAPSRLDLHLQFSPYILNFLQGSLS